jgi:hypothetical protein
MAASVGSAACLCFALAVPSAARCDTAPNGPHTLSSIESAVVLKFDTLANAAINDANRIDSLTFPGARLSGEMAATEPVRGPNHCHDPDEFFGQALGYPDSTQGPLMVASGERASWSEFEARNKSYKTATTFTGLATCPGTSLNGLVRTIYTLNEDRYVGIRVDRTFNFKAGLGVLPNSGLRAYLPRVAGTYHYVLVPNKAGKVISYDANNCTTASCTITDWNGTWVADTSGATNTVGLVIVRDPSSTMPAFIGIQGGGVSKANFTSIVLSQPSGGWSGTVRETEYLCFFDYDTWTPAANTLPAGCAITTPIGH